MKLRYTLDYADGYYIADHEQNVAINLDDDVIDNQEYAAFICERLNSDDQSETIARLQAERDELIQALQALEQDCDICYLCEGEVTEGDACRICGGYGFNVGGDYHEHIIDARDLLAKLKGAK